MQKAVAASKIKKYLQHNIANGPGGYPASSTYSYDSDAKPLTNGGLTNSGNCHTV